MQLISYVIHLFLAKEGVILGGLIENFWGQNITNGV